MAAHGGEGVGEGRRGLGVPGGLARGQRLGVQRVRQEDDEAEEAEEGGSGAPDSPGRPLPLRLDAEVGADFFKGDLGLGPRLLGGWGAGGS